MDIKIDWYTSDGEPGDTCYCRCGRIYRSHTRVKLVGGRMTAITRKKCPGCGEYISNCFRISSDPEIYTIGGKK